MFTWDEKELKLFNQKDNFFINNEKIYDCENATSREDKIEFVDAMQNGKLSYILSLAEQFQNDVEDMPKDKWGDVKTVSLKAWINRNDKRKLIDNLYRYGHINFLTDRDIQSINKKSYYDTYNDYVDEIFHCQLKKCEEMERKYFLAHDEYSILKQKFRDCPHHTTFGVKIGCWSDGRICVEDENSDNERDITIEELKYLLSKYEELDKLIDQITKETDIKY